MSTLRTKLPIRAGKISSSRARAIASSLRAKAAAEPDLKRPGKTGKKMASVNVSRDATATGRGAIKFRASRLFDFSAQKPGVAGAPLSSLSKAARPR